MESLLKALAERYRFPYAKGNLALEDLFQIPLTQVNDIAVSLHEEAEQSSVSFIDKPSPAKSKAVAKLEVVKMVISYRQEKAKAATQRAAKASQRSQIDELIAQKENESLSGLSVEELIALRDKV